MNLTVDQSRINAGSPKYWIMDFVPGQGGYKHANDFEFTLMEPDARTWSTLSIDSRGAASADFELANAGDRINQVICHVFIANPKEPRPLRAVLRGNATGTAVEAASIDFAMEIKSRLRDVGGQSNTDFPMDSVEAFFIWLRAHLDRHRYGISSYSQFRATKLLSVHERPCDRGGTSPFHSMFEASESAGNDHGDVAIIFDEIDRRLLVNLFELCTADDWAGKR
ncbi:MAG: hypothetical protein U5L08_16545 [Xanthomonadales bacterium]|nr:hypothetical protein [Xanthomonadales bacterium]